MSLFLISLAVLIGGYFIYGTIIDRIVDTRSDNPMPAITKRDDIDFRPLPTWKIFLIQFLNIAGLGPIFGAIMGIMFGPAAFLWIALGTIFAGATHDFISGVISIRMGGASLPEIIGKYLGTSIKQIMRVFTVVLLILVAAVFVINPATLLAGMTPQWLDLNLWIIIIFAYYILATLLPIDKLIGNLYPIFGFALLFMALGLLAVLLFGPYSIPLTLPSSLTLAPHSLPIFPMMFVSIACGAISGFHATQSPMMARCMTNERHARPIFYGAMVAEGIVALIWAAAAITFTGGFSGLHDYMTAPGHNPASLVNTIAFNWLGPAGGLLALLGVIAAPITTGDTALRSARLSAADMLHFDQSTIWRRLIIALPLFACTAFIMMIDFNTLWRYFAWCNQTLSVFTLWAATVYLAKRRSAYIVTLLPAMFMTAVCTTYILGAQNEGFGLDMTLSTIIGVALALVLGASFMKFRRSFNIAVD